MSYEYDLEQQIIRAEVIDGVTLNPMKLACAKVDRLRSANAKLEQELKDAREKADRAIDREHDTTERLLKAESRLTALERDGELLDSFESIGRKDYVEGRQISEDECEAELLGHYWETAVVQSVSVREALAATIEQHRAQQADAATGKTEGGK